jgi:hypothetical protein
MSRPALEVADIFRDHGAAWRRVNVGHVSLDQLKVMSAIERCRTAALGGHVARCEGCAHTVIACNVAGREADLLPVPYFHVVFTLPARIAAIAYQNKAVIYDISNDNEPIVRTSVSPGLTARLPASITSSGLNGVTPCGHVTLVRLWGLNSPASASGDQSVYPLACTSIKSV